MRVINILPYSAARWQSLEKKKGAMEIERRRPAASLGQRHHLGQTQTLFLFDFHHGRTFADMEVSATFLVLLIYPGILIHDGYRRCLYAFAGSPDGREAFLDRTTLGDRP